MIRLSVANDLPLLLHNMDVIPDMEWGPEDCNQERNNEVQRTDRVQVIHPLMVVVRDESRVEEPVCKSSSKMFFSFVWVQDPVN